MLRKGIAIICRTQEERDALCKVANQEGYKSINGRNINNFDKYIPIRISFNTEGSIMSNKDCCTQCDDLNYPLNPGITEVYEASQFLHNAIISERIKRKE